MDWSDVLTELEQPGSRGVDEDEHSPHAWHDEEPSGSADQDTVTEGNGVEGRCSYVPDASQVPSGSSPKGESDGTKDDIDGDEIIEENENSGTPRTPHAPRSWVQCKTVFEQYPSFFSNLPPLSFVEEQYDRILLKAKEAGRLIPTMRKLVLSDRFFLLTRVMGREDAKKEAIYKLCRMVEADTDGYLDLWSREHYKTSIITNAGTIQEVLRNPEITIGIFSFNKPIAKSFLKQIMREFENNEVLKKLFPDILYGDPKREAKRYGFAWSADAGITVKRKGNPKEATVEAWGLVDGQPTSKHFDLRIYNDVVTRDTVRSETSLYNTRDGWELSLNLASGEHSRSWYEGTIYHNTDVYATIRDRKAAVPRIVPITFDRKETGVPTVFSRGFVKKKRREMGAYNFACQCLLLPQRMGAMSFDEKWLKFFPNEDTSNLNKIIIIDPAGEKKANSDYTSMVVLGFGSDHNTYVCDIIRDKLSLKERIALLFRLENIHKPYMVYYEKYGMQSDVETIREVMKSRNYHFPLKTVGGILSKRDRIMRLQSDLEIGKWFFPESLMRINYQGASYDAVQDFVNFEYLEWPFPTHDDVLDSLSRKYDADIVYPDMARLIRDDRTLEHKPKREWRALERRDNVHSRWR